jgi:mannose-1-phosphate guanylyltransferase
MRNDHDLSEHAWAVVLAGGEGMRLRSLTREVFGDERPKQYAPLVGAESLLRQTLERAERLIPAQRTVVVSQERQAPWLAGERGPGRRPKVLFAAQDPEAIVVAFPSDHFVLEEAAFLDHVAEVVGFIEQNSDWIVLLGARATAPDPQYGWIEPGDAVGSTGAGPISRVVRFREKPTPQAAVACLARGWLWNTFVFVARAGLLVSVGDVLLPELHRRLTAAAAFFGTRREAWAIGEAYANLPRQNFSELVLQAGLPFLAVSTLPPLTWSDLGTPQRVFKLLRTLSIAPAWARGRQSSREIARKRCLLVPHGARLIDLTTTRSSMARSASWCPGSGSSSPTARVCLRDGMPGTDAAGAAGFHDQVNHHLGRVFGSALLLSVISAGVQLSQIPDFGRAFGGLTAGNVLGAAVGQQLGQTSSELIRHGMNVAPTIEIGPGYAFNVMVTQDLVFPGHYDDTVRP